MRYHKYKSEAGFGILGIIVAIAVIGILTGGGFYFKELQQQKSLLDIGIDVEKQAQELKKKIEEGQNQLNKELGNPSPQTQLETIDTSTWKTYRNEKYGFEVRYPNNIKVADTKEVIERIPLGYIKLCDSYVEETLLCLYIPREAYPNSTFEAGALSIERVGIVTYLEEQIDTSKNEESCLGFPSSNETPKHVVNGITFDKDSFGDGASGHTFEGFNYRTYHGGHCFQLTTGIALYGRAPSDLPERGIRVFSKQEQNEIFETFDQILSTFKFLP